MEALCCIFRTYLSLELHLKIIVRNSYLNHFPHSSDISTMVVGFLFFLGGGIMAAREKNE